MTTIKNINENFGMNVSYTGADLEDCIAQMESDLEKCDFEHDHLLEGIDYEITE